MARVEAPNFNHQTSTIGQTSSGTSRSISNQTCLTKDNCNRGDIARTEFTSREGIYRIFSSIDIQSKNGTNTSVTEPVKMTFITRVNPVIDTNSATSSKHSSPTSKTKIYASENLDQIKKYSLTSKESGNNLSDEETIPTQIFMVNVGRELTIYEFSDILQTNIGQPIDHRIYKQNHNPTCHDIVVHSDTNVMHVLVGFSKGQIQYINMRTKEQKVFNDGSYLDKTKVTCIKWLTWPKTHFAVSYSSGHFYVFDEELNHQREPNVQMNYSTIKDDEKNVHISYIKNKDKQIRNPISRWSIGSGSINGFAFSPDSTKLAVVSQDGFLRVFNYEKMEIVAYMKSYFGGLLCVCWSPDGKYLATGGEDDFLTLFSMDSNEHSSRVLCRGRGHTSWINAISFDSYMNAKTYYSSSHQRSTLSLNNDEENYNEKLNKSMSYSTAQLPHADTNIPSLFYRIGSVGQDNRLCFWDITEDILKINKVQSFNKTNHIMKKNSCASQIGTSTSNGYLSHSSDIGSVASSSQSSTMSKTPFSSLASRLSFSRHSNRNNKSTDPTSDSSSITFAENSTKKSRKLQILSHTSSRSKSSSTSLPNTKTTNDCDQESSLLTFSSNSLSSRRTNFNFAKSLFGTNLCPKLEDVQIIEPIVTEIISHDRLNGIYFAESVLFTSSQDGVITIWEKPHKSPTIINTTDNQTKNSTTFINSNSHNVTVVQ